MDDLFGIKRASESAGSGRFKTGGGRLPTAAELERSTRFKSGERQSAFDRYKLLVNHTRDIIYFTDQNNRIVEANAAAARAYGYSPDEMIGLDVMTLQSSDTCDASKKAIERARSCETVVLETKHRRKNGVEFPVEVTLTPRWSEGDGAELLAIVRDTTADQAAEESVTSAYDSAIEAARLKTDFVAAMGHEMRTPMNAIIGMSELLLETQLNAEQRSFTEAVRQSGKALLGIIDDVLDFSQIESGGPELEMTDVDVTAAVASAVAVFAPKASASGLTLNCYVDPKIDGPVRTDASRLHQILIHLIDNAVKFTETGGVVVSVTLEERDEWSTTLHFAVEDSGLGIGSTAASLIFEPFQQADRSTTRTHSGVGLGLPIARRLVELMGGSLCLESVPGVGSTFWFTARFDRASENASTRARSPAGTRVLVVDDDPMSREILQRYVLSFGMEIGLATNGVEALDLLRERQRAGTPFDVAIIDYTMPGGMGGLELGMRIKANSELADTQLIMITAYKDLQQRQAVGAAGFSSYLTKPFDRAQLLECVGKAVHRSRAHIVSGPPRHATPGTPQGDGVKRIILVEDHPINQQLGVQQLKKLGFDAIAVSNGEQALEALATDQYDLVFMDCQMPKLDGFATTRAIRALEEQTGRHVPIVAMTANALVEDRRRCLDAGMDDYLAKPVQLEHMQAMIQRWVWDVAVAI